MDMYRAPFTAQSLRRQGILALGARYPVSIGALLIGAGEGVRYINPRLSGPAACLMVFGVLTILAYVGRWVRMSRDTVSYAFHLPHMVISVVMIVFVLASESGLIHWGVPATVSVVVLGYTLLQYFGGLSMIRYLHGALKVSDPEKIRDLYILSYNPNLARCSFEYLFWVCPLAFGSLFYSLWCAPLFLLFLVDFCYSFARPTIPAAIVLHASYSRMSRGYLALKIAAKPMSIPHLSKEGDEVIPADWRLAQDCLRQIPGMDWRESVKYMATVCQYIFVDASAWSANVRWEADYLDAEKLLGKTWFLVDEASDEALAWIERRRQDGREVNCATFTEAVAMLEELRRRLFPGARDWLPLERLPGPEPVRHRTAEESEQRE